MIGQRTVAFIVAESCGAKGDGIVDYGKRLFEKLKMQEETISFDYVNLVPSRFNEWLTKMNLLLGSYDIVHLQYPFEAWGRSVIPGIVPGCVKLIRKMMKRKTGQLYVTFHEWRSMHPLRKLSVGSLAILSDHVIFVSSQESKAYMRSIYYKLRVRKPGVHVIPIGVNLTVPRSQPEDVVEVRKSLERANGTEYDLLLGYFGFIYSAKQPHKMLQIVRWLKTRNIHVRLVVAGDFQDNQRDLKDAFFEAVTQFGLDNDILFLGYVSDEQALSLTLSACDFVLLLYDDGISSRRGSMWYVCELGIPIVSTSPEDDDEIDLKSLGIDDGRLLLTDPRAPASEIGHMILRNWDKRFTVPEQQRNAAPQWPLIAEEHHRVYSS